MKKILLSAAVLALAFTGCKKDETTTVTPPVTTTLATVTTTTVSEFTKTTATVGGNVTADGGATVTERGVYYGTTPNPTTNRTIIGTGKGSFTKDLTGLELNTTYYVKAFAKNSVGEALGSEETFKTKDANSIDKPTITTTDVTNIIQTQATSGVVVTSDGGATVSASGVCWSTTANPTVANDKTTGGSGAITGLTASTTYFVRAYATNSAGTAYGNEVSFKTLEAVVNPTAPDLLITEFQAIGSFEFIEIYNNTSAELKLSDFSLAEVDAATGLPTKSVVRISTTSKNYTIKTGEYKIIVPDISGNKNLTDFMNTYSLSPSDTLGIIKLASITKTDGGDDIVILKYGTQEVVDQLGWTSAATLKPYYGGVTGAKENSAERNKLTGSSTDGANWNKSLVIGTPGKKNSVM